jgi:hypothetical protein
MRCNIEAHSALVVQAGTATSLRARGEPNSFNVVRINHPQISVERLNWKSKQGSLPSLRSKSFSTP